MDLAGAPSSFASSSPTRPGRQLRVYLEVRAVCELGKLQLRLTRQFTICQKNYGLLFYPRGFLFLYAWVHVEGQGGRLWQAGHFSYPTSPPGNIRTDVGLRHHQDVWMTHKGDPLNPKGGQCWLCRSTR